MELELNGRAGLLHIRRRRALVRSGLRRSRAHLARSRDLDRPGSGMGPRLGRAVPGGARVPPLGTADAAHVRPSRSRAAPDPVVALLSLGEPRKFLLRPKGGGKSQALRLGRGDLLVTGGKTQRAWDHSVPKVAQAGPRISIAYRYGLAIGAAAADEY